MTNKKITTPKKGSLGTNAIVMPVLPPPPPIIKGVGSNKIVKPELPVQKPKNS